MNDLGWAASWVGWGNMDGYTDADLAEAVRVKWIEEWTDEVEAKEFTVGRALYLEGPIAFIKAVREVVA